MKVLYRIILTEWRLLIRSRTIVWLLFLLLGLSVFTILQTSFRFKHSREQRNLATQHMREKFTAQGEVNPHSAAHYGHYVYKPLSLLSILDEGVNPFTGISLRLEGHVQNETLFSPSQSTSSIARFGQLRLNLLLQVLLPLFILFVCHKAISAEKEKGTLPLLLSQGTSLRRIIWAKTFAYSTIWLLVLLFCFGTLGIALSSIGTAPDPARITGLLFLYLLYYFIITALAVYVSAKSRTSAAALLTLLSAWIVCTVLLPKAAANIGDHLTPLVSRLEMEKRITEDNKKGINGHDPSNERTQRFKDSLLKTYAVDSIADVPVNIDGLTMQADEEYHNLVYDKHLGEVQSTIHSQNNVAAFSSWINPFAAVRNTSMSLAATDLYHHFDFTSKAEGYRRYIVKKMNEEMAYGGSKTGDWDWAVDAAYWEKIPDFAYTSPTIAWSVRHRLPELAGLLAWLSLVILLIHFTTKRISLLS